MLGVAHIDYTYCIFNSQVETMATRTYTSLVRTAAAAEKRERVIQAAITLLRESESAANFSLDTVAKIAGVTRLTVYNQFGSRRGLLEEAFDDIAVRGRLGRLKDVQTLADPREGIARLVEICCDFWSSDPALARIYDAMVLDQEFEQSLIERNERRRQLIQLLIQRMAPRAAKRGKLRDTVDLIFALTSMAMFRLLVAGRSPGDVSVLIQSSVDAALDQLDR